MRYWFDTEFIEDERTIDLISIGIVAEDGREYYAENADCDISKANAWVMQNMFPHLFHVRGGHSDAHLPGTIRADCPFKPGGVIAAEIVTFVNAGAGKPEFWGCYADYDWVVLCQLFGTMMDLPKGWPMLAYDLKQWCDMLGNPKLPEQGKGEHHALADARWNKQAWELLADFERERAGVRLSFFDQAGPER